MNLILRTAAGYGDAGVGWSRRRQLHQGPASGQELQQLQWSDQTWRHWKL